MSEHKVTTQWKRESEDFDLKTYNRGHEWHFEGGVVVKASAAAAYQGDPELVDPEQAFTAALSRCHMLTFLAIACQKGFVVDTYTDAAVGELGKNAEGEMAMVAVTLHPEIVFSGDKQPSESDLSSLHDMAHKHCFLANSVTTEIKVV